jgi:transposase
MMDPKWKSTEKFILLPELNLVTHYQSDKFRTHYKCVKESEFEVCPRCAVKSYSVHDRRWVRVQDQPIRGSGVYLRILKRRFRCPQCKKVFTEPIPGIRKGFKTTERYRRGIRWACENFKDLKSVQKAFGCSAGLVYKTFYEQLALKLRERKNNPWPTRIGIDEHSWLRGRTGRSFVSLIVDYDHKKIFEAVEGKTALGLSEALTQIPGRERVKEVALDLCDPFKKFAREMFPNARIVADHFHVVRLLNPALNRARTEITGDKRSHPGRKLLLMNGSRLEYFERRALHQWLEHHPKLKEIYCFKEAIHRFYRIRGYDKAARALIKLTDQMALSQLDEIKTLRRTLMSWRKEILNYFVNKTTNARTEGFNNLAKLLQKRAFGFRSFFNYRLRLLSL